MKAKLNATPDTVHWGYFRGDLAPVLEVDDGDIVEIRTVSGGPEVLPDSDFTVSKDHRAIVENVKKRVLPGHILTGPVAIKGLNAGDTLEIRIIDIRLDTDWGWNIIKPLAGTLPEDFPDYTLMHLGIDRDSNEVRLPWGKTLNAAPFFGVMGVAPPMVWGELSSKEPRAFGGNMDLKELQAGATLFLPTFQDGGLFSTGDGHAIQGDGEVCVTAVETGLIGTFSFHIRKDISLTRPRAETDKDHITIGLDPDLDVAAKSALRDMIDLIMAQTDLNREQAYSLCSMVCDLRITQTVNGVKGVHAVLEKSHIR
ncbi:MAG: acetamidase/formamidase family protein [Methyloligellaceae bacterium]